MEYMELDKGLSLRFCFTHFYMGVRSLVGVHRYDAGFFVSCKTRDTALSLKGVDILNYGIIFLSIKVPPVVAADNYEAYSLTEPDINK